MPKESTKVPANEEVTNVLKQEITDLKAKITNLETKIAELERKIEDLKGYCF